MVGVGPKQPPSRKGSMHELPQNLLEHIKKFEEVFTVDAAELKKVVKHFVSELEKGMPEPRVRRFRFKELTTT
ncbi:hexokinase-domain-containing protein [Penicillium atrosanguineum]|uniref:uncharacterized protein n=1 Tax=Penicillium atrosanguineum TaxID=1132637 RepID=UPI00238AD28B|nr:uncharacterized protein N7443_006856 [Penicillium atrosanguineum]KAJ5123512.1 hexokinase-domain-containing protein [Penicillium atrosanguineum]KAJ5142142.1 hexokinase-domain-containing protein [Penicillium atrosanguineum]KAJ5298736.1 hypothetical protein N7443_006856 [Penicillium atrosanguineum]